MVVTNVWGEGGSVPYAAVRISETIKPKRLALYIDIRHKIQSLVNIS